MNFVLASGFAAAVVGFAPAALAQQQSNPPASQSNATDNNTEEVVVTAQRYEQRLQDVPASLSVLSGNALNQQGAKGLEDVEFTVPGFSMYSYAPGEGVLQIRGAASINGAPTVGQYFNEMPITGGLNSGSIDIRTLDIARVEVLRGPQPTLYGEGSMGGTIHYVPAMPNLENYSASFEAETGAVTDGEESYRGNAVVNLPIGRGVVGLRLAGQWERDGGWIDDANLGLKDMNRSTIGTERATLLIQPSPNTDLTVIAMHQDMNMPFQNFGDDRKSNAVASERFNDKYDLVNAVLRHDFGNNVDLTYSFGFTDRHTFQAFDITPFFLPATTFLFGPGFVDTIDLQAPLHEQINTNELRLSSQHNSFFDWTVGVYTRHQRQAGYVDTVTTPFQTPFQLVADQSVVTSQSWAAFGDATFHFTPQLSALVGARYYHDNKSSVGSTTNFGLTTFDDNHGQFSTFNPRLNVMYEFSPSSMVYFNVAKGFRSGGFNSQASGGGLPVPPTYKPDSIWSYELGTHQQFFDGRLAFDGAVYYEDWKDVLSSEYLNGSAFTVLTNGGSASGFGVDLNLSYMPITGLTLSATYGWNNLEYTATTAEKDKGDPIDYAVRQSYSASAEYRRPVFGTTNGYVRVDFQHADAAQISERNFGGQIIPLPARNLVDGRVGLTFGNYDFSVFATNLLDENHPVIKAPFGVLAEDVESRPREIGVTLRAHY
jgi:outer membrane receptor protein involved in Fe transport